MKLNYRDWKIYFVAIISLSIWIFTIINIFQIFDSVGLDQNTKDLISSSLKISIRLISFIAALIVELIIIVVSYFIYSKAQNKYQKWFATISFIGLSATLPIWALLDVTFYFMKRKFPEINNLVIPRKGKVTIKILSWALLPAIALPLAFVSAFASVNTNIEEQEDVLFSKDKTNLIEIFSDGLDHEFARDAFYNDSSFEDFWKFDKYITPAEYTDRSVPTIQGGMKHNPFNVRREYGGKINYNEQREIMYGGGFTKYMINHFNDTKDSFNHDYLYNVANMSPDPLYTKVITGDLDYFNSQVAKSPEKDHLSGLSYEMAKRQITNGWGVVTSDSSPDALVHRALRNNIKVSEDVEKGGHVLIYDHIVHGPIYTNTNGNFAGWSSTVQEAHIGLKNVIAELVAKLKSEGVYDNTMIVIWGDHGSHFKEAMRADTKTWAVTEKTNSGLFIKYPNSKEYPSHVTSISKKKMSTHVNGEVSNKIIFAPYMKNIIKNELDDNATEKGIDFINNNNHFVWNDNNGNGMRFPLFTSNSNVLFPLYKETWDKGVVAEMPKYSKQNVTTNPNDWTWLKYGDWRRLNNKKYPNERNEDPSEKVGDIIFDRWGWEYA